nr:MAG TPA_asm: hypothetical protein [Caudoviricetes sp.]
MYDALTVAKYIINKCFNLILQEVSRLFRR